MRYLVIGLAAVALSACTAAPDYRKMPGYGQGSGQRMGGALLRPTANPGEVAATDIAFSRAARDEGQWTAFRRFAADGAKIHGRNGVIEAEPWLAAQDDPAVPVQWTPVAVWSSCDGSIAVTQGKFADPDGQWGYYVTVWERQRDGRYRWVYDMGAPDDELTASENAKRERDAAPRGDNVVVIEAVQAIEGRVADCRNPAEVSPPRPTGQPHASTVQTEQSRDGSLQWRWTQYLNGRRTFAVQLFKDGAFQEALSFAVDADGKHIPAP